MKFPLHVEPDQASHGEHIMTATEIRAAVDAILAREGITYAAAFVPQSKSRNAKYPQTRTLNWRVSFARGKLEPFSTDYMQGIGHIPGYQQMRDHYAKRCAEHDASENGRYPTTRNGWTSKALPAPSATDVLYCLALDASALDAGCFELWADEYGYERDSRAAEVIYKACIDSALAMRAVFGDATIRELRDATAEL